DVRLSASVEPAAYHVSSYADSSLPLSLPSHFTKRQPPLGMLLRNASVSASVSTGLLANCGGRWSGVADSKLQTPCRSGRPSAVRGTLLLSAAAPRRGAEPV